MHTMERNSVLGGFAYVLNAAGKTVAKGLVATSEVFGSFGGMVDGAAGKLKQFSLSGKIQLPGTEASKLRKRIKEYEAIIQQRYLEIGRESANTGGDDEESQKATILKLIEEVREYDQEIKRLKGNLVEMDRKPDTARPARATSKGRRKPVDKTQALSELQAAIRGAVETGHFANESARATFKKVAEDLLDEDAEVRALAASELGKLGNPACVGVLVAAARLDDPDLVMEAINALSGVEDPAALELFKESTAHPKFGVRLISLRGVYKLAPVEEAGPILIGALVDEHPEVRRTVAAYLGWKDFPGAGPALIQCLRDEDANVRKSAVTALASLRDENAVPSLIQTLADSSLEIREKTLDALQSIIGKPVKFDVTATDQDQERAIVSLLEWWNALNSGAEVHAPAEAQEPAEKPAPVQADEIVVEAVAENMQASAAPVQESAISDFGLPEPVTWDGSSESVSSSIDAEAIKDMSKGDLLAYCDKHGIACDPKLTKAEIKKILLGNP